MLSLSFSSRLIGALIVGLVPSSDGRISKDARIFVSVLTFGASIVLLLPQFKGGAFYFQFEEKYRWFPDLGIAYT